MAGGEPEEMTCRELVELVTDYLEGTLPSQDRMRLDAHLAGCPYCEEYIAQMRRTVAALGRLPPDPVDPAREQELLEMFRGWRRGAR
jgi:anti-sigma factor RsiW